MIKTLIKIFMAGFLNNEKINLTHKSIKFLKDKYLISHSNRNSILLAYLIVNTENNLPKLVTQNIIDYLSFLNSDFSNVNFKNEDLFSFISKAKLTNVDEFKLTLPQSII